MPLLYVYTVLKVNLFNLGNSQILWISLWAEQLRPIKPAAILHPSVIERFMLLGVSHYGIRAPYRPENLRTHEKVIQFYSS